MKKMKLWITFVLLSVFLLTSVAYAKSDNGKGKGQENSSMNYGQLKKLDKFDAIKGEKIKVNNKNVEFDLPPVIKEGRTLIPVRALTEALGCKVEWISPRAFITNPDGTKVIMFNLQSQKTYVIPVTTGAAITVTTGPAISIDDLKKVTDDNLLSAYLVELDVAPGLINNRTFVPLRFIAEEFDLRVDYDENNGNIHIQDKPELLLEEFKAETKEDVPSQIDIGVDLNGYQFVGIDGLTVNTEFTLNTPNVTGAAITINLKKSYVDTLTEEETKLVFRFNKDTVVDTEIFEIELKYLK